MTNLWDNEAISTKKIAIYGTYKANVPVNEIVSRKREDGSIEHYLETTLKEVIVTGRYEFHGKGSDLYKAIMLAHRIVPKGFVDISAKEFLENPEDYGYEGEWIEREIES